MEKQALADSYDLTQLEPHAFEHLVNALALRVLGNGTTGFGPGADGGRDGYFEGEAPYPSNTERWSGQWYIQSKFHKPHLSTDAQAWLREKVSAESRLFQAPDSNRKIPDNWIIATNIDPSGKPETGTFDKAKEIVAELSEDLATRFHIWGGRKILDLLDQYPDIRDAYGHFLTPGHLISELRNYLHEDRASVEDVMRSLIVADFDEQQHTRLEQAGSSSDTRPGIHELFIDLPYRAQEHTTHRHVLKSLTISSSQCHKIRSDLPDTREWRRWFRHPHRSRVWFVRGGPGQGKSTVGQYFCQIQRAALILQQELTVLPKVKTLARDVQNAAMRLDLWTTAPRIPVLIELKEYAQWLGEQHEGDRQGVVTYLTTRLARSVERSVSPGTLTRAFSTAQWFFAFDGVDEVPGDIKDHVLREVRYFLNEIVLRYDIDALALCTSRPQGYAGQLSDLDAADVELTHLNREEAFECARPVLSIGRSVPEVRKAEATLKSAIQSPAIAELMRTPLQSHIMAVVVRNGGKPPERRWQLFNTFYNVIRQREANKDLPDQAVARLLRDQQQLLKTVHNRLGFALHSDAETKKGAVTSLTRADFEKLAKQAVEQMADDDIDTTTAVLMRATVDRLVLVSTPDDGEHLRFDIRPLQEFFAAEFIYDSVTATTLEPRLAIIAPDAHWREVTHFLISALVEHNRLTDLAVALNVLENIDEGEPNSPERTLNRRMARGAITAARLLNEGVLEEDMRVRQLFQRCLSPLNAAVDVEYAALLTIPHERSRKWIICYLLQSLLETDSSENVGAAMLLSHIVPDGHELCTQICSEILHLGESHIDGLLLSHKLISDTEQTLPEWITRLAVCRLTGNDWTSLSPDSLSICLWAINVGASHLPSICDTLGYTEIELRLLTLFSHDEMRGGPNAEDIVLEPVRFGKFRIYYMQGDWSSDLPPAIGIPPERIAELQPEHFSGIFRLALFAIKFTVTRDRFSLCSALELLAAISPRLANALPSIIRLSLPYFTERAHLDQIANEIKQVSDEKYFHDLADMAIAGGHVDRVSSHCEFEHTFDANDMAILLDTLPHIGLMLWGDHHAPFMRDATESEWACIRRKITRIAIERPFVATDYFYKAGKILEAAEGDEQDVRRRLLEACGTAVPNDERFSRYNNSPFAINLPAEAAFLPWVASSISSRAHPYYPSDTTEKDTFRAQALEYNISIEQLRRIYSDKSFSHSIRASAAILVSAMENNCECIISCEDIFLDTTFQRHDFLFRPLALLLAHHGSENDVECASFLGRLLGCSRENLKNRRTLGIPLETWREMSHAPVTKHGVREKWLNGDA